MSSYLNNYSNTRSMNGLTDVNANNVNSTEVDTETLRCTYLYSTFNRGTAVYDVNLPSSIIVPATDTELTNKKYVDDSHSNLLASPNAWTGNTNTYNSYLPTSSLTPSLSSQFTTKVYVDDEITTSKINLLAGTNAWTGNTNTFNLFLPTSSLTPSADAQLSTKKYVDDEITTSNTNLLAASNAWTGTNTFNSSLPTSSLTPATDTQLTTKVYVDNADALKGDLAGANAWTGNTNTFNSFLPTSSLTPSADAQLSTKKYVDDTDALKGNLAGSNTWTGANTFSDKVITNTIDSTSSASNVSMYSDSSSVAIGSALHASSAVSFLGKQCTVGSIISGSTVAINAYTSVTVANTGTVDTNVNGDIITIGNVPPAGSTSFLNIKSIATNIRNAVAGVYIYNGSGGSYDSYPLFYSTVDLNNSLNQPHTSGTTNYTAQSGASVGQWVTSNFVNINDRFVVLPRFGIIGYANTSYGGSILINFKNTTSNPVSVKGSSQNSIDSVKIYFNDVEQFTL